MYDYGARNYDPAIGRWMNIDNKAEKYYQFSPYVYVGNMPTIAIDPDGNEIVVTSEVSGGKTTITITVTGKVINDSGTTYTQEQMQAYASRLASSISSTYTGSDGDISWKGVANISVATEDNKLKPYRPCI